MRTVSKLLANEYVTLSPAKADVLRLTYTVAAFMLNVLFLSIQTDLKTYL